MTHTTFPGAPHAHRQLLPHIIRIVLTLLVLAIRLGLTILTLYVLILLLLASPPPAARNASNPPQREQAHTLQWLKAPAAQGAADLSAKSFDLSTPLALRAMP